MAATIGVRFREAGKIYYFDAVGLELDVGEFVVVETVRGVEVGRVVIAPDQVLSSEIREALKPVIRVAERGDVERMYANRERARADLEVVKAKVAEHGLAMHVVSSDYNLDLTQYTVYFTADERVDFRALVRDLSTVLKTRVQLLQVGERDRAKLVGGLGRCGRHLCCSSWLTSFPSISIKMAKEQDLPLNPSKISGVCGRLLCCLAYEYEQYKELRGNLPKVGATISTPVGNARVVSQNTLRQTITIQLLETLAYHEMPVDELKLQYGLTVRPLDVQEEVERPIREYEQATGFLQPLVEDVAPPVAAITTVRSVLEVESVTITTASVEDEASGPEEASQARRRRKRKRRGRPGASEPPTSSGGD